MADRVPDRRHSTTPGVRLRLFARLVGLAGLLVAPAGAGLMLARGETVPGTPPANYGGWTDWAGAFAAQAASSLGAGLVLGGLVAVAVWAVVELLGVLLLSTGQRSAQGFNTVVQVGLAVGLLVIVNAVSFGLFGRYDLTRDQRFTLPPDLVTELKALRADSPTTVIVVQSDRTGPFAGKPDAYDTAAEAVTVEKVQDLVAQLREFGPQFRVELLKRGTKDFDKALAALSARRPGLSDAVNAAPESSVFFYADEKVRTQPKADADRLLVAGAGPKPSVAADPNDATKSLVYPAAVTRMAFSEFYQLDKQASREAPDGNLVLLPRGPAAFVRRVLAIDERRPRVGLVVVHPYLSSKDTLEDYTASGLRAALERNGFDVQDVILKKWTRTAAPTPDALTYEETDLDRAESRYLSQSTNLTIIEEQSAALSELLGRADKALARADAGPAADRGKAVVEAARALAPVVRAPFRSEADVRRVRDRVAEQIALYNDVVKELVPRTAEAATKYQDRLRNERAAEGRRVTDVRAKFAAAVADCDVLIVPRLTVIDIARAEGGTLPSPIFNVSAEQAGVVREFLDAGKPVLFAVGPPIEAARPGAGETDEIERLLYQLGVRPGRQTILTDDEVTAIAEQQGQAFGAATVKQPVTFDRPTPEGKKPNPVAEALRVTGRSAGDALTIRQGAFRAISASDALKARSAFPPEFLFTAANSFNEDKPVAEGDYLPKYEPARLDDPRKGTPDEERRASFPVGLAAEVPVPATWAPPPGVTPGDQPLAGIVGAGLPSVNKVSPAGVAAAAALAARFDGGVLAAAATIAAWKAPPPKTVRVVVVGHGGLFVGKQLEPGPETLLVSSLNWQLNRSDRLAAAPGAVWSYPRAHLNPTDVTLWRYGAPLYLPLLVAAAGATILAARRLR